MKVSKITARPRTLHRLVQIAVFLLILAVAQAASASTFGFNYWPYGYSCRALDNANWAVLRPQVAADFDHIASLGGGVVRLMFWPQESGFHLKDNYGGGEFTSRQFLNRTQDLSGPAFTPSGWSFNNYLHRAGSWSATLRADTRYIIVSIDGTVVSAPGYLDVDAVSVFQQP